MKQETEPGGKCADAEHSAAQRASEKKIQIFIANKLKKVEKYFLEPEPAPPEASPSKLYKKNDQNDGYLSRNVFNAVRRIVATVTLWIPRSSAISACFFCSK